MNISIDEVNCDKLTPVTLDEREIASFSRLNACQVCSASNPWRLLSSLGMSEWTATLDIGQCQHCGVISYINPPGKEAIANYYRAEWNLKGSRRENNQSAGLTSINRKVANLVRSLDYFPKDAEILDVGCGLGGMLGGFAESGFGNLYGIEESNNRVELTSTRFPGRIFEGGYESFPIKQQFDVIYANHVVEHISAPGEFISWLSARLKENGMGVICVPHSFWEPVIVQLCFLPHLHSFGENAFRLLGEKNQLAVRLWNKSDRLDELCVVFFRKDSMVAEVVARNPDFSELSSSEKSEKDQSQVARFSAVWGDSLSADSKGLLNWPNSNHLQLITNSRQRFESASRWNRKWALAFRLLAFKRRLALRFWMGLSRGDGLIYRALSRYGAQVTDFNYLLYTRDESHSRDAPMVSMHGKAPLLVK